MSQKQFTKEQKKKYILFANEIGMIKTLDIFFNEFHSRYENNSSHKNINSFKTFVFTRGKALINNWLYKYNNGMELQSKTGKTGSKRGRLSNEEKKKFEEQVKELFPEILKKLRQKKNIKDKEIRQIIDEIIEENPENFDCIKIKTVCDLLSISRTKHTENRKKDKSIENYDIYKNAIIEYINNKKDENHDAIGYKKIYQLAIKENKFDEWGFISIYRFKLIYSENCKKCSMYNAKSKKPPKEEKYKDVWAPNLIKSLLKLAPFMVWTADIKYVFCDGKWRYLHVIRDQLTNIILAWKLQLTRTAQDSIDLFKKAMKKWKIKPKYVHTDHGVEYANFAFKTFLEKNGIIQSMSAKGKSLENRGSEYFFCNIQQELFNTLKHIK